MGASTSTVKEINRRRSSRFQQRDYSKEKTFKVLLVGAERSGKSTLLKQLKFLYGNKSDRKETESEKKQKVLAVHAMILDSMATLLQACQVYTPIWDKSLQTAAAFVIDNRNASSLDGTMKKYLVKLWKDRGVQRTLWTARGTIQLPESLDYFMGQSERVFAPEYEVTDDDWIRAAIKSLSVAREELIIEDTIFEIYDINNPRENPDIWLNYVENVDALVFLAALSTYDEESSEDGTKNLLELTLKLFGEISNHSMLKDSGFVLLLSKEDVFKEKLYFSPIKYASRRDPAKSRWLDFPGPQCMPGMDYEDSEFDKCYRAGLTYIKEVFAKAKREPSAGKMQCYSVNLHDSKNVDSVVKAYIETMGQELQ